MERRQEIVPSFPPARTVERKIARSGLSRPSRHQPGYISKGVPYSTPRVWGAWRSGQPVLVARILVDMWARSWA